MQKTCLNCQSDYEGVARSKYCSRACARKYLNDNRYERTNIECLNCGTPVANVTKSRKYCSKRCSDAYNHMTRENGKEKAFYERIWSKYRLSAAAYEALIANGCEVCGSNKDLHVDHDHACCSGARTCGKCIRGVLCAPCNKAEGLLRSDPNLAMQLAFYMAKNINVLENVA